MGKRLVVVAAAVAVTLGAGLTADALAEREVEKRLGDRIACEAAEVELHGFPALPQLLRGELDEVEIGLPPISIDDHVLDASVTASGVSVDGPGHADHLEATAVMGWEQARLSLQDPELASATLGASDDLLAINTSLPTAVAELPATVLAEVSAQDGEVVVTPTFVQVGGRQVAVELLSTHRRVGDQLDPRSFQPSLPAGLRLTDAAVDDDGISITVAGEDVDLAALEHDLSAPQCLNERDDR